MPRLFASVIAAAMLGLCSAALGEVIGIPDGAGNVDAPPIPVGWDNVGSFGSSSCVYLGNGWVLTANHVGLPPTGPIAVVFDVGTYYTDSTRVRITNPNGSGPTDIQLVHLTSNPALPRLNIGSLSPSVGTKIYSVGYGLTNTIPFSTSTPPVNYYDSSFNTPTAGDPVAYGGFDVGALNNKHWASNETVPVDSSGSYDLTGSATAAIDVGQGPLESFFTRFYAGVDDYQAMTALGLSESQLGGGDSGGAVFDSLGNLIGMNDATSTYDGQPADTALFGNMSAYGDLATYRDEILSDIPEPSGLGLGLISAALCLLRRGRSRR